MNPVVDAVIEVKTVTAFAQVTAQTVLDPVGVDVGQLRVGQPLKGWQVTLAHGQVTLRLKLFDDRAVVIHEPLELRSGQSRTPGYGMLH
ncbi:hypothetical protein D3C76_1238140 [compost metagenome]